MPKTYTAAGTVSAGDVYTAAAHNIIVTDVNNLIVPAAVFTQKIANQSLANGADTALTFPAATYDTDGMYSGSATDRITIQTAGIYQISATVNFTSSAVGERIVYISGGGSRLFMSRVSANASGSTTICVSGSSSLAAAAVVQVFAFQSSGGALNVIGTSVFEPTNLSAVWVGRTA
jgi:hypothetical protein